MRSNSLFSPQSQSSSFEQITSLQSFVCGVFRASEFLLGASSGKYLRLSLALASLTPSLRKTAQLWFPKAAAKSELN
eukprot:5539239-Amphidinium_carterae.1